MSGGRSAEVGCTIEQFRCLKSPTFKGATNSVEVEWISQTEKVFDVLGYADEHKFPFTTFLLKGEVGCWWKLEKRVLSKKENPLTWEAFLESFQEKYFLKALREQKEVKFLELVQGSLNNG